MLNMKIGCKITTGNQLAEDAVLVGFKCMTFDSRFMAGQADIATGL